MIVCGGKNISSKEIEEVLHGHPAVLEAAVVGRRSAVYGEEPVAFVTLRPGRTADPEELLAHSRQSLARFKVPRAIFIEQALPKTAVGKIAKPALRSQLAIDVRYLIGQELGVSNWLVVEQSRIDQFAECTGDHQWIHVDRERAAKGPFGKPIAHGYLTLALVAATLNEVVADTVKSKAILNYGIERARFINPVKAGSRVRNRVKLAGVEPKGDGRTLYTMDCTLELDGEEKPALVVSVLAMAVGAS